MEFPSPKSVCEAAGCERVGEGPVLKHALPTHGHPASRCASTEIMMDKVTITMTVAIAVGL
jgi:hypothetical protein